MVADSENPTHDSASSLNIISRQEASRIDLVPHAVNCNFDWMSNALNYLGYDNKVKMMVRLLSRNLGNVEYPFLTITIIDETLTGTTTAGEGGSWSNDNEEVLHIPQSTKIGFSPSYAL